MKNTEAGNENTNLYKQFCYILNCYISEFQLCENLSDLGLIKQLMSLARSFRNIA